MSEPVWGVLTRAADQLEALAAAATPGPWHYVHTDDGYAMSLYAVGTEPDNDSPRSFVAATLLQTGSPQVAHPAGRWSQDAAWIATMSPVVAAPLVEWLRLTAKSYQDHLELADGDHTWLSDWLVSPPWQFARAVLSESEPVGVLGEEQS